MTTARSYRLPPLDPAPPRSPEPPPARAVGRAADPARGGSSFRHFGGVVREVVQSIAGDDATDDIVFATFAEVSDQPVVSPRPGAAALVEVACRGSLERRVVRLGDDEAASGPEGGTILASAEALLGLPAPARTVPTLACLGRRSCDDIGGILGLDRSVVDAKLRESLALARRALEERALIG